MTKPTQPAGLAPRQFALDIARLAAATRCHNVVVLDVSGLSPVTDFFVICTGTSARQMKSAVDDVAEYGEEHGYNPYHMTGEQGENWILADFIHVVFHAFSQEARSYYDLDNLWGDAQRVEWNDGTPPPLT